MTIEIRKVIKTEDKIFPFVEQVSKHLDTKKPGVIIDFILKKASKIPFKEFINK